MTITGLVMAITGADNAHYWPSNGQVMAITGIVIASSGPLGIPS